MRGRYLSRAGVLPADARRLFSAAEIIAFDNLVVVYKFVGDLHFYATAEAEENEVVLSLVLSAFFDTVSLLLTCAVCNTHTVPARVPPAPARV